MRIAAGHAWILHEDDRFIPTRGTGKATKELRYYRIPIAAALNGGELPDLSEISQYVAAKHPQRLDLPTDIPLAKFRGYTRAERFEIWGCYDNLLRMMADADLTTRFGENAEWEQLDQHQVPFDFIVQNGATTQFLMRMEGTNVVGSSDALFPRRTEDTIYVIEYRIHNMGEDDGEPGGRYFFRDEILCTFDEGFHAVTDQDGYYFVTETGSLFATRRADDGQTKKTAEVRIRSGELVQAIVFDADRNNTAFAFTSNYWFEVKKPIEYREFTLPTLKPGDPLPALVECAREVRKFYPATVAELQAK